MYLSNKHFDRLLEQAGEDKKNFDRCERLSSKAMIYSTDTKIFIFYVNTLVFKKDINGVITLNTNGWLTNTTKKWINYGLTLAGDKYCIIQKNFEWYINKRGTGKIAYDLINYKDGIILNTTLRSYVEGQVKSGRFDG